MSYSATVKGSDAYKVQLQIDHVTEEIIFHDCTCPYDGEFCKHRAAVLFAIVETPDGEIDRQKKVQKKKNIAEDILGQLSEAEVKQYLTELIAERRDVSKHFIASFIGKTASDKADHKKIIGESLQGARGANSFRNPSCVFHALDPVRKSWNRPKVIYIQANITKHLK